MLRGQKPACAIGCIREPVHAIATPEQIALNEGSDADSAGVARSVSRSGGWSPQNALPPLVGFPSEATTCRVSAAALVKAMGGEQAKAAGKTIPPDKLQEMVRAEVDRILREQGLGGFVSQGKEGAAAYVGRAVAVIPDLDTPRSYDGLNRTLAMALGNAMGKTKDLKVSTPDRCRRPCARPGWRAS